MNCFHITPAKFLFTLVCLGGYVHGAVNSNYVPDGTYKNTCYNISVGGHALNAVCLQPTGQYRISVLPRYDQCVDEVQAINGQLYCRRATQTAFGHGSMTASGKPATGTRPLAVVLLNSPEANAPRFTASDRSRFNDLIFAGSRSAPDMFSEMSDNRFTWESAGVHGPFQSPDGHCGGVSKETKRVGRARLRQRGVENLLQVPGIEQYDLNGNNALGTSELGVIVIYTCPPRSEGGVPDGASVRGINASSGGLRYSGRIASGGQDIGFSIAAHEFAHLLGTIDLYGERRDCTCWGVTLMGSTTEKTRHLDPAHRFLLGWIDPEIINIRTLDRYSILQSAGEYKHTLLYDPERGSREFFLVESRYRQSIYEEGLPDNGLGVLVWRVNLSENNAVESIKLIRPDSHGIRLPGVSGAQRGFTSEHGAFSPVWSDGTPASVSIKTSVMPPAVSHTVLFRGAGIMDAAYSLGGRSSYHLRRYLYSRYNLAAGSVDNEGVIRRDNFWSLPNHIDAMLVLPDNNIAVFRANRFYHYNPLTTAIETRGIVGQEGWFGLGNDLDAALQHPDGSSYFFKNSVYYRYSPMLGQVAETGFIFNQWPGIPGTLDAALMHPNGDAYFFKGSQFYRFNLSLNRVTKQGVIGLDDWDGLN